MVAFLSASDTPLSTAALYALVGFVIVVLVLALLVGIFYLSGFIFKTKFMSRDKLFDFGKKKVPNEPEIVAEEPVSEESDAEVVAAITAAISVILAGEQDNGAAPEFVIRRISRK
ncbi:MAG: OadG family protein [Clostridiales bacterium]|nr:OadG family protein [Clostridiales bacterium]